MRAEETPKAGLRPPRPSPAPERWPEPVRDLRIWWWISGLGGFGLILMAWAALSVRRGRVAAEEPVRTEDEEPGTPSERVLRAARALRGLLSERFGALSLARTVEEIAESQELQEALGVERFDAMMGVLQEADRVKFADEAASEDQGVEAEAAVEACRAALDAEGAISRINGR